MPYTFHEQLCKILVKRKVIDTVESDALRQEFNNKSKEAFTEFLLHENIVEKSDLLAALSDYYQVPAFDATGHFFKQELVTKFPQEFLTREGIIPLEEDEDILVIVASEPDNENLLPELSEYISDEIQFYVGLKDDIVDAVREYYESPSFVPEDEEMPSEQGEESEEQIFAGSQIFDDPYSEDGE